MNFEETLHSLDARIGRGWRLGLDGMRRMFEALDAPRFPVILVGGTNGKGSAAWYTAEILRESGLRVGVTTSPHLLDIRERIIVDGAKISREDFASAYAEIEKLDQDDATYFEALALMAILHFARMKVDVAVVEIGMGGRLDAFNVLDPLVSVITSIGLDHTRHLGATLDEIAVEKAQIARRGRPVIVGTSLPALRTELERIGANVETVTFNEVDSEAPDYAAQNRAIALAAAESFFAQCDRGFDRLRAERVVERAIWPGRFQMLPGSPRILLDAAHNPPAARALARRLAKEFPGQRIVAMAAFLEDKDHSGFFAELAGAVSEWYLTQVADSRGLPVERVAAPLRSIKFVDRSAAFRAAADAAGEDILLITGSIYLLGETIRHELCDREVFPWK